MWFACMVGEAKRSLSSTCAWDLSVLWRNISFMHLWNSTQKRLKWEWKRAHRAPFIVWNSPESSLGCCYELSRYIILISHERAECTWPNPCISGVSMLFGKGCSQLMSSRDNWCASQWAWVLPANLSYLFSFVQYYHSSFRMAGDGWLVCCGQYNDILIIDAITLVVLHTLTSSSSSDWISCMCLVRSLRIQGIFAVKNMQVGCFYAKLSSMLIHRYCDI